jgi:hypothetical protein
MMRRRGAARQFFSFVLASDPWLDFGARDEND